MRRSRDVRPGPDQQHDLLAARDRLRVQQWVCVYVIAGAAMVAAFGIAACNGHHEQRQDVIELGVLRRVSPAAEHDMMAAFAAQRPLLSTCSDPWRPASGTNSVPAVVHAIGARGGVVLVMLEERTQLGPEFDACFADALRTIATRATGDYDLVVRARLCIGARRP